LDASLTTATPAAPPRGVVEPIPRELLRLALPVAASQLLRIGYQWVDALWVRGLGVEATAAVTTSMFVMWAVYSLHEIFGAGVAAYVSQLLGAGERTRAGVAAFAGLRATAAIGLACAVVGGFGARWIYGLMHAPPGVTENGARYLAVVLAGAPFPLVAFTAETIMRASGNTRVPLTIDVLAIALNALLDPFLIYGWGPFPRLGVAGAAWATVLAQALAVVAYGVVAWRRHPAFPLARRAPGPPIRIARLARVGIPTALIGMMFSLVYVAFSRSAARYGAASLAIVGIANRIEAIQFIVGASLGIAGATLVGQNLGARRPDRAALAWRTGLTWAMSIALVVCLVTIAIPGWFVGLFTRDAETLRLGVPYLRILALGALATGAELVTVETIYGSGHTRVPSTIFNVFSIARIPLAFWVPTLFHLGVLGIAWLITVTCVVRASIILTWAARGTWKLGLGHELTGAPPPAPEAGVVA
jgi:putative MATE family efflux protein